MPVQSGPHLVPHYSCQLFTQGKTQEDLFLLCVRLFKVLPLFQGHGSSVTFRKALHVHYLTCAHIMEGCIPVMTLLQSCLAQPVLSGHLDRKIDDARVR